VPAEWCHFLSVPGNTGLPLSGRFLFAQIVARVRRLHRSHPIDVIHAHGALPCGHAAVLLGAKFGIPVIVSVHGLDAFSTYEMHGRLKDWRRRVSQNVYTSAARIICVSDKVRQQVVAGSIDTEKTTVVYNGVDPDLFSPSGSDDGAAILSVGDFIPTKGQEILLRAFASISPRFPEVSCKFIGDGPESTHIKELAQQLGMQGRVHFLGRQMRRRVADAMRSCTVFALPSRYEGLGCVYLEAMSAGKPVIGCQEQGIQEVIQHGENGWLVDADDVSSLAAILSETLGNPALRRRMGMAARQTIEQHLTLRHQAARLLQVYREACA
jgi:glycosyltransferase involved in cell wall biosynthesis